jgi:hypothetical protein
MKETKNQPKKQEQKDQQQQQKHHQQKQQQQQQKTKQPQAPKNAQKQEVFHEHERIETRMTR